MSDLDWSLLVVGRLPRHDSLGYLYARLTLVG